MSKNLLIASDHAGYELKLSLISLMHDIFFEDLGTDSDKSVDYPDFAKKLVDINCYISISGIVTFKNSIDLTDTVSFIPLEKLLVETDSPYLSPVPHRGKPNEPGRTRIVAEKLADIHNVSLDVIAIKTSENATTLFNLPS